MVGADAPTPRPPLGPRARRLRKDLGAPRSRAGLPVEARAIPDKLYFRIGEVAALAWVPAYVLRYWQTEFPQLQPKKSGSGQRLYRRRDVELLFRIRDLLYRDRFTIAGAKRELVREERGQGAAQESGNALLERLTHLRERLEELAASLAMPASCGGPGVDRTIRTGR